MTAQAINNGASMPQMVYSWNMPLVQAHTPVLSLERLFAIQEQIEVLRSEVQALVLEATSQTNVTRNEVNVVDNGDVQVSVRMEGGVSNVEINGVTVTTGTAETQEGDADVAHGNVDAAHVDDGDIAPVTDSAEAGSGTAAAVAVESASVSASTSGSEQAGSDATTAFGISPTNRDGTVTNVESVTASGSGITRAEEEEEDSEAAQLRRRRLEFLERTQRGR